MSALFTDGFFFRKICRNSDHMEENWSIKRENGSMWFTSSARFIVFSENILCKKMQYIYTSICIEKMGLIHKLHVFFVSIQ